MDYKLTLNLPQTDFPMQGKLPEREPATLARWQEHDLYAAIQAARSNAPVFILHDGPPYANGKIHIGHAVNKILKDIINKSKLSEGYRVPYVPGWDCHGLPIEIQVKRSWDAPEKKSVPRNFATLAGPTQKARLSDKSRILNDSASSATGSIPI
jgi:Isoleucyl-tRNA synthetase